MESRCRPTGHFNWKTQHIYIYSYIYVNLYISHTYSWLFMCIWASLWNAPFFSCGVAALFFSFNFCLKGQSAFLPFPSSPSPKTPWNHRQEDLGKASLPYHAGLWGLARCARQTPVDGLWRVAEGNLFCIIGRLFLERWHDFTNILIS